MLGSVPCWPCGYIQRPYLLLRSLALPSASCPSFSSSHHAFDMHARHTHALWTNRATNRRVVSYLATPFLFPIRHFLLRYFCPAQLPLSSIRGRPTTLCSSKNRSIHFDSEVDHFLLPQVELWSRVDFYLMDVLNSTNLIHFSFPLSYFICKLFRCKNNNRLLQRTDLM